MAEQIKGIVRQLGVGAPAAVLAYQTQSKVNAQNTESQIIGLAAPDPAQAHIQQGRAAEDAGAGAYQVQGPRRAEKGVDPGGGEDDCRGNAQKTADYGAGEGGFPAGGGSDLSAAHGQEKGHQSGEDPDSREGGMGLQKQALVVDAGGVEQLHQQASGDACQNMHPSKLPLFYPFFYLSLVSD